MPQLCPVVMMDPSHDLEQTVVHYFNTTVNGEKNGMGGKIIFQCFRVLLQKFAGECKTGDGNHEIMQFQGENNTFVTEHKRF